MAIAQFLAFLLGLLQWAIIIRVVISWIRLPADNPIVKALDVVCEPLLAPLRQLLPPLGGLDFSPLAAIVLLGFLQGIVIRLV